MEHGSFTDDTKSTFAVADEDHTLANAIRFTLNQDPRVSFCGYSIPHPSDNRVNIRVQTTGDPAKEVLKDACHDLMLMCQHVRGTFDQAVVDFKTSKPNRQSACPVSTLNLAGKLTLEEGTNARGCHVPPLNHQSACPVSTLNLAGKLTFE